LDAPAALEETVEALSDPALMAGISEARSEIEFRAAVEPTELPRR